MVRFLSDAYKQARTLLDDDEANNWPDYKLRTKAIVAFEELEAELIVAGIPIIHALSSIITVPAQDIDDDNLNMSTVSGYPTDMILPIWMKERQLGEMNRDFVDMVEVDFIPNIDLDIYLHYWCWYQNTIMLRGALNSVQVELRYQRYLPLPEVNTDSLIVPLGQLYIGNRIAALAFRSMGNSQMYMDLTNDARTNLNRILDMNIKELQDMPAKRRPYHRGYGRNRVLRDF
jgi:hypothetical protein